MMLFLVFSIVLLLAVLLSKLSHRSVLSSAVVFLLAGFLMGGVLHVIPIRATHPIVSGLAELALFSVLFTDGMRSGIKDLVSAWKLPGRALIFGLPLTVLGTALLGHYVAGLGWLEAFLVGAVLSPTDPVFAAAIIGREEIPERLRHLLNVESGLNDGLALPLVLTLLAMLSPDETHIPTLLGELGLGILLGTGISWLAIKIEESRFFEVAESLEPLFAFSVGAVVFAASSVTHANEFLAAFSAGITLASMRPALRAQFREFGGLLTELLKLAAVLVFGALISPQFFAEVPWQGYVFAALALLLVRPVALWISFWGTRLGWREEVAAYWFGPKGFASVVYGLILLKTGLPGADYQFHLIAIVITASIVLHSSTDVLVARWFKDCPSPEEPGTLRAPA